MATLSDPIVQSSRLITIFRYWSS